MAKEEHGTASHANHFVQQAAQGHRRIDLLVVVIDQIATSRRRFLMDESIVRIRDIPTILDDEEAKAELRHAANSSQPARTKSHAMIEFSRSRGECCWKF
jgi:hypothetical protein